MNRTIRPGRVAAMLIIMILVFTIYLAFLYKLQIIEGEKYYNQSNETQEEDVVVTAARGNILDRYGRVLVKVDTTKLFANDDPNEVILELCELVEGFGDTYTDDLPITMEPPFEYSSDMTEIQRTMLRAYFKDKAKEFKEAGLPEEPSAIELMSYMRTRYEIDNSYSAEEMRRIAGIRYSINVRYAINTAEYVFVEDASMELITSIMENKLAGI